MMISGAATGINTSGVSIGHAERQNSNNDYKMKHNSSNQSIHSQKKIGGGISTIRKPGAGGELDNSF